MNGTEVLGPDCDNKFNECFSLRKRWNILDRDTKFE